METPGMYFWILAGAAFAPAVLNLLCLPVLIRYRRKNTEGAAALPVSLVIAAKNELENLKVLLPLVLEQNHAEYEVVVVDDRSDDGTYEYLLEQCKQHPVLHRVRIDETPDHISRKKYALTLGIRACRHDIVLLCDADCRPASPDWMSVMTDPLVRPEVSFVLGYSQYERRHGFLNLFIRFETLLTGFRYVALALMGRPYMGVGRNLAYRKNVFLANNGFGRYQRLLGGDDDLFVQAHARGSNTRVQIGADCLVYSIPETGLGSYFRQKKRHLAISRHYKFSVKILLGLLGISSILFWSAAIAAIATENDRSYTIGVIIAYLLLILLPLLVFEKKSSDRTPLLLLPLLDLANVVYLAIVGTAGLLSRKLKWK